MRAAEGEGERAREADFQGAGRLCRQETTVIWRIYKVVIITEGKSGEEVEECNTFLFRGPLDQALAHVEGRREAGRGEGVSE